METKRLIFDLDGTLINWCPEYLAAFKKVLAEYHVDLDYHRQGEFASTYEKYYPNFNFPDMQQHFYHTFGLNVPLSFFEKYLQYLGKMSKRDEKLCELLAELEQSYELVVLTNWFKSSQLERLKNAGIAEYFREIIGGDEFIKPNPQSYLLAMGNCCPEECVMIGDSYDVDIKGAIDLGMPAIYIGQEGEKIKVPTIANIYEIRKVLKR